MISIDDIFAIVELHKRRPELTTGEIARELNLNEVDVVRCISDKY